MGALRGEWPEEDREREWGRVRDRDPDSGPGSASCSFPGSIPRPFLDPFHDPAPDPFSDPDPIRELEDRILEIAAQIDAATFRLLDLVAEFDRRRGYELGGHASTAHWLAARAGLGKNAARERVRTARALETLPLISAKMASGQLSYAKARALTRIATPELEAELVELSLDRTAAEVEQLVRGWRLGSAADEAEREELRYQSRSLTIVPGLDGMYQVRGILTPEQAAMVMRGIDAASDALFREAWPGAAYASGMPEAAHDAAHLRTEESRAAAARCRADGLALLAERALWAGFSETGSAEAASGGAQTDPRNADPDSAPVRRAVPEAESHAEPEAFCGCGGPHEPRSAPAPISGSRAARTQVVLHVDLDVLRGQPAAGEQGGDRSELADGVRVTAETSRRLSCDASVVPLFVCPSAPDATGTTDSGRRIVDIGHMKRIVSPALRRALDARDGGCRFPGCGCRFTEAHHVIHWSAGGETSLENCVLLCRHHHRLLHEGRWSMVYRGTGNPIFHDPLGGTHYSGRFRAPTLPPETIVDLEREAARKHKGRPWEAGGSEPLE
ncbi:HNH endonuclease signature motif containing protein [soil metagenome]